MCSNASKSRRSLSQAAWCVLIAATPLLTACFTLTELPRALVAQPDGAITISSTACAQTVKEAARAQSAAGPTRVRIMSWNIHKEGDVGWQEDLTLLGGDSDILTLQEVTLKRPVLDVLQRSNFRWVMASSFAYEDYDVGVLTATRIVPISSCAQRAVEPLLQLPKSALISWFATNGKGTLAVVNLHAINFTLSTNEFQAQLQALAAVLAIHEGPIIFAGDFNTWSTRRQLIVDEIAKRLGLEEIRFADDKRTRFFGNELDHILTRGFRVIASSVVTVTSSDHNPVFATLELAE